MLSAHFGKVLSSAECGRQGDFLDSGWSKVSSHPPVQVVLVERVLLPLTQRSLGWTLVTLIGEDCFGSASPHSQILDQVFVVFLCIQRHNF